MIDDTTRETSIVVPGLRPSTNYLAQIAVVDEGSIGPWSAALGFRTFDDDAAPAPPSNAEVTSRGASFIITWDSPTTNEDGSALTGPNGSNDFRDYVLRITSTDGAEGFREITTADSSYTLTLAENTNIFGGTPKPELTLHLSSRDVAGNESDTVVAYGTNPPPIAPVLEGSNGLVVTLEWTRNDDDIFYYQIFRGGVLIGTVSGETLAFQDSDYSVESGEYSYHVRAVDVFGQGTNSNSITRTKTAYLDEIEIPPLPPTNLSESAELLGPDYVEATISWDAPTAREDDADYDNHHGFDIIYQVSPSTEWIAGFLDDDRTLGTDSKTFVAYIDGIPAGRTLTWGVRAVDDRGNRSEWAYSEEDLPEDDTIPAAPTGLSANGGIRTVYAAWDSNEEVDIAGYRVYASTSPGVDSTSGSIIYDGPGTSAAFFGLEDDEEWFIVVYAYDTSGNVSLPSAVSSATTIDFGTDSEPPGNVTGVQADANTYFHGKTEFVYMDVSWTPVGDEDLSGYIVAWREQGSVDWNESYAGPTSTTMRITGLRPETHVVRIRAQDAFGNLSEDWSSSVSVSSPDSAAAEPTDVPSLAATSGVGKVIFSWPDNTQEFFNDFHLQVATNSAFTANRRDIYIKSNEYHFTGVTGQTYYARVKARTTFGVESSGWSDTGSGTPTGITMSDVQTLDLTQDGKFTGRLKADYITIGSTTLFPDDNYDPTTKATPGDLDIVQEHADSITAAVRRDFTGSNTGTLITREGIETGTITGDLLDVGIAVVNGLRVQSLFEMNAGGEIVSTNFYERDTNGDVITPLVTTGEGYRLTTNTIEHYGSSFILGANGLNISSEHGRMWFGGNGTFDGAAFRVDSNGRTRVGTSNQGIHLMEDGSLRIGSTATSAPVYITSAGVATFKNIRISPGSMPPSNTNIINAGNNFIVKHLSGGTYETRIAGDLWIDSGGNLRLSGGSITLSNGNLTLTSSGTDTGNIVVSGGKITSSLSYTGSGTGYSLESTGVLRASNAVISGQLEVTSSSTIYKKTETYDRDSIESRDTAVNQGIRSDFGGSAGATTITGDAIKTGTIQSNSKDPDTDLPRWWMSLNGDFHALTGLFGGALIAASGTFKGALTAATGTFTGNLTGSDMRLTGTLKMNGATGSRIELSHSGGIQAFNSGNSRVYWVSPTTGTSYWYDGSGTNTVTISGSTGKLIARDASFINGDIAGATITGAVIRTAVSGPRIEIKHDFSRDIRFYSASGDGSSDSNGSGARISYENDSFNNYFLTVDAAYGRSGFLHLFGDYVAVGAGFGDINLDAPHPGGRVVLNAPLAVVENSLQYKNKLWYGSDSGAVTSTNRVVFGPNYGIISRNSGAALLLWRTGTSGRIIEAHFGASSTMTAWLYSSSAAANWDNLSDYRFKENVRDLESSGSIRILRNIKPRRFDWIEGEDRDRLDAVGFIAHELQEYAPHAVSGEKDATKDDGSPDPQGTHLTALVPNLVQGWQEHDRRIEEQEETINSLRAQLEELRELITS